MAITCPRGTICSDPYTARVGKNQNTLFFFTSTAPTQDKTGKVNGGNTTLYYSPTPGNYIPAATTADNGKTWNYLKDSNNKFILGDDARKSLETGVLKNNTNTFIVDAAKDAGIPKAQADNLKLNKETIASNAPSPDQPGETDTQSLDDFQKEFKQGNKENTRETYSDVKYPENLQLEKQDCIKFSIVKYIPPGVTTGQNSSQSVSRIVTVQGSNPTIKGRTILGTITLPIPAGINDSNSVDWQNNTMDDIQKAFADISLQTITGGGEAGVNATKNQLGRAAGESKNLENVVASKFTEAAVGATNILSRQYGAVVNTNLELLFSGPSLRTHQFTFKFTPRTKNESFIVKKIIRYFKQSMSVKRSKNSLLLKAPHTFAISYLSQNKDHPYLNKFKECALTSCNVNYTPDGSYMTYMDTHSMTSYELNLTFQELDPIFDDEYFELDKNRDSSIGF